MYRHVFYTHWVWLLIKLCIHKWEPNTLQNLRCKIKTLGLRMHLFEHKAKTTNVTNPVRIISKSNPITEKVYLLQKHLLTVAQSHSSSPVTCEHEHYCYHHLINHPYKQPRYHILTRTLLNNKTGHFQLRYFFLSLFISITEVFVPSHRNSL